MKGGAGLQLGAALMGRFEDEVRDGEARVKRSLVAAATEYGGEVQGNWRSDIERSQLANTTALRKTIRLKTYANTGLNPAVVIWSKFPLIQRAFEQSITIMGRDGLYLAVPTEAAGSRAPRAGSATFGRRGKSERITPGGFERRSGLKLRFVYRKSGPSLLVVDGAQLDRRRGGKAIAYRGKGQGSKLYGPEGRTIVVFVLVKQVRTPRLLRGSEIRRRAEANAPGRMERLFAKHFDADTGAPRRLTGPST